MIFALCCIAYVVAGVITATAIIKWMGPDSMDKDDPSDCMVAFIYTLCWPIVLAVLIVHHIGTLVINIALGRGGDK